MKTSPSFVLFLIFVLWCAVFVVPSYATDKEISHQVYLERANSFIKSYRHFPAVDALKQAAKISGDQHPSIHMRLAILYYGLGFIPEAIAAGEKAVALAPKSKWYKYDLAKFYFVDKQFEKSRDQFMTLLEIDPGFTLAYVYLGEVYYQFGNYPMAWLCSDRADSLGHDGTLLREKLKTTGEKPGEDFVPYTQNHNSYFRFAKLSSEADANSVLKQIDNGKSFENLELELQNDKNIKADFGVITTAELDPSIVKSVQNIQPFAHPTIIKTGSEYRVIQRILPFDKPAWDKLAKSVPQTYKHSPQIAKTETVVAKVDTPPVPTVESALPKAAVRPSLDINITNQKATVQQPLSLDEQEVSLMIFQWKAAWEKADVQAYLSFYSEKFLPQNKMPLESWKKKRAINLTTPKTIEITLSSPVIVLNSDNSISATFNQMYKSDKVQDTVKKTLSLKKESSEWKIVSEDVVDIVK